VVVSKVIQIRDVPDEVRDALAEAAEAEGLYDRVRPSRT